jgi:hypothetical protein
MLSAQQLKEQAGQIAELMEKGLIRESTSSWGSPVLFVKKANVGWRMCVDYRGLNLKTRKNGQGQALVNVGSDVGILTNPRSSQRRSKNSFQYSVRKVRISRHAIPHEHASAATFQTLTN